MNIQFLETQVAPLPMNNRSCKSYCGDLDNSLKTADDHGGGDRTKRHSQRNSGLANKNCMVLDSWGTQRSQTISLADVTQPGSNKLTRVASSQRSSPQKEQGRTNVSKHSSSSKRNSASSFPLSPLPKSSSQSIPIASGSMKRTVSELQLMEDEAMADYRDFCMYLRIVNGMNERRSPWNTKYPTGSSELQSIIRTRHQPIDEGPSSYMREGLERHSINSPLGPQRTLLTFFDPENQPMAPSSPSSLTMKNTDSYYNHPRQTTRNVPTVVQEPDDFHHEEKLVSSRLWCGLLGGGTTRICGDLPVRSPPQLNPVVATTLEDTGAQEEEMEGIFMMDDM